MLYSVLVVFALHQCKSVISIYGSASGKKSACQCRRHKRCWFSPWVGKMPWRRKWQCAPVFLPRESHCRRLVGYSPWGHKESGMTSNFTQVHARTYIYISPLSRAVLHLCIPPLSVVTESQAGLAVLYSSFPLVIHFTHDSIYISVLLCRFVLHSSSCCFHQIILYVCVSISSL